MVICSARCADGMGRGDTQAEWLARLAVDLLLVGCHDKLGLERARAIGLLHRRIVSHMQLPIPATFLLKSV